MGKWGPVQQLTSKPTGGYRPQIAVGANDVLHAVYYDRTDDGDIIRHRIRVTQEVHGLSSSVMTQAHVGTRHCRQRRWLCVVVYDHALEISPRLSHHLPKWTLRQAAHPR